jgi:adenylate kinase
MKSNLKFLTKKFSFKINTNQNFGNSKLPKLPGLYILMIGAPGVGKGTYSGMLSKDLNLPELSSGDHLRKLVKSEISDKSNEIKKLIDLGKLVDDQFMFNFMLNKLSYEQFSMGVILDGYPRNINQAEQLEKIKHMDLVLKIQLNEEILIRKLLGRRVCKSCDKNYNICSIKEGEYDMEPLLPKINSTKCDECNSELIQREDDTEKVIRDRLSLYKEYTKPLEDYYQKKNLVRIFEPKKGIKDYPILLELVKSNLKN